MKSNLLPSKDELDLIYNDIDKDKDGTIEFKEFCQFMTSGLLSIDKDYLLSSFNILKDPSNEKNLINYNQLKKIFIEYLNLSNDEIDNLIGHYKLDHRQNLNYLKLIEKYCE